MRVKICGIRNFEDAMTAIQAGANAIGFLVGITHLAEDKITKEDAKAIIEKLPPFVSTVLVTHLTDTLEIVNLAKFLNVNTVQIHDYIPPKAMDAVRAQLPNCKLIKAIHVLEKENALSMLHDFEGHCDAVLLDSRTKERLGGTGMTHDWSISRKIVEESTIPVILAGGLTPDNVYAAVTEVGPFAVDVNSGVEEAGYKAYKKIVRFIQEAGNAELGR